MKCKKQLNRCGEARNCGAEGLLATYFLRPDAFATIIT